MMLWGSAIECVSRHLKSVMVNVFSYSGYKWKTSLGQELWALDRKEMTRGHKWKRNDSGL